MAEQRSEFDSPWKEVIEDYFQDFLAFFFPDIHADVDWSKGYEFLDTELQQIVRDAELGKRFADKLVKVWRLTGEELWVLIHIEIQQSFETLFPERMFVYNYRLGDRYDHPVVSLAVLTDDRPSWRPQEFRSEIWGCETLFRFPMVKLLDYGQGWQALEDSLNPFATVVMAHLKALETKGNQVERKDWKFNLTRRLYEKGYERQDVLNLFRFIDWVITLPPALADEFEADLERFERENQMPYVTSIERRAEERGRQQGLLTGTLDAIGLGLELKFGSDGLRLLTEISQIHDLEALKIIQEGLRRVNSIDELRALYRS
jgi:hypothetical protein